MSKKQEGIFGSSRKNKERYLIEYQKLYQQGLDDSEIARQLGVSHVTTRYWRLKLGLSKNFKYQRKFNTEKFLELYNKGFNYSEIARCLGISTSAAQEFGSSSGLKARPKHFKDAALSPEELQILIGTIYGDASLGIDRSGVSAFCCFTHSTAQQNYCIWKYEQLKRLASSPPKFRTIFDRRTEKTYYQVFVKTHSSPVLGQLYSKFYKNRIKYINEEMLSKIEALGLAIWFMDDGSKTQCGYSLVTNCFSPEELDLISRVFKAKFDLNLSRTKENVLLILAKDKDKFTQIVRPYIHKDCLYKLHGIQ